MATAVAIDSRGRVVVAGYTIDGSVDLALARFRPDGSPDPTFSGDGRVRLDLGRSEFAFDMVLDDADRPVVAGMMRGPTSDRVLLVRLGPTVSRTPPSAKGTGSPRSILGSATNRRARWP